MPKCPNCQTKDSFIDISGKKFCTNCGLIYGQVLRGGKIITVKTDPFPEDSKAIKTRHANLSGQHIIKQGANSSLSDQTPRPLHSKDLKPFEEIKPSRKETTRKLNKLTEELKSEILGNDIVRPPVEPPTNKKEIPAPPKPQVALPVSPQPVVDISQPLASPVKPILPVPPLPEQPEPISAQPKKKGFFQKLMEKLTTPKTKPAPPAPMQPAHVSQPNPAPPLPKPVTHIPKEVSAPAPAPQPTAKAASEGSYYIPNEAIRPAESLLNNTIEPAEASFDINHLAAAEEALDAFITEDTAPTEHEETIDINQVTNFDLLSAAKKILEVMDSQPQTQPQPPAAPISAANRPVDIFQSMESQSPPKFLQPATVAALPASPMISPAFDKSTPPLINPHTAAVMPNVERSTLDQAPGLIAAAKARLPQAKRSKAVGLAIAPELQKIQRKIARRDVGWSITAAISALIIAGSWMSYNSLASVSKSFIKFTSGIDVSLPAYIPKGFELKAPISYQNNSVQFVYQQDKSNYLVFLQNHNGMTQSDLIKKVLSEESDYYQTVKSDTEYYIYDNSRKITWVKSGILFVIISPQGIPSSEWLDIAQSIKPKR